MALWTVGQEAEGSGSGPESHSESESESWAVWVDESLG